MRASRHTTHGTWKKAAAVAACAAMVLAGCSSDSEGEATGGEATEAGGSTGSGETSDDPIKIGLLQPLTGPISAAGAAISEGAQMAVDEINEDGGVNGRQIELIIEDDENDPAVCTSAATKVIERDNVVGVIGGWGSSCTLAIAPVTTRAEIPLLVETSSSYKVTDPAEAGGDWVFRINAPTRMEVDQIAGSLSELGMTKVAFLPVNNDWGRGSVEDITPALEAAGIEVVATEFYEQTNENFAPLLTSVQSAGADGLIITTDAAQIALILQQMESMQMSDLAVLTTGGSNFPGKVASLAGESALEGTYHTVFFPAAYDASLSADPERAEAFVTTWNAEQDPIEIGESPRGYDAIITMAAALESIDGDITPQTLRDALDDVSATGIMYGDIAFEDTLELVNQNVAPVYLGRYTNGTIEFLGQ